MRFVNRVLVEWIEAWDKWDIDGCAEALCVVGMRHAGS